jgi:hypothetical protein
MPKSFRQYPPENGPGREHGYDAPWRERSDLSVFLTYDFFPKFFMPLPPDPDGLPALFEYFEQKWFLAPPPGMVAGYGAWLWPWENPSSGLFAWDEGYPASDPDAAVDPYSEGGGEVSVVAGVILKVPSTTSGIKLEAEELGWCQMVSIRTDVLYWYQPPEGIAETKKKHGYLWEMHDRRCANKLPLTQRDSKRFLEKFRRHGLSFAAEALADARVDNPGLVRFGPPYPLDAYGGTLSREAVKEAQMALGFLGFRPGWHDGVAGRLTVEAVMRFQVAVGIPASGAIDEMTMALLRNSSFGESNKPVHFSTPPD